MPFLDRIFKRNTKDNPELRPKSSQEKTDKATANTEIMSLTPEKTHPRQKDPHQLVENAAFLKANSIFLNDTLENLIRSIVVNLQRTQIIDTIDAIIKDPTYQTYIKQKKETEQVGGYDPEKMSQVRKSLDYLLSDSFHDFGKGRNPYFPNTIYRNLFVDVKYEKIKALTQNIYHGNYQQKDHPDFLYNYLSGSKFEEQVKVDFLTGELVGDIPDISYFFSENGLMNWPVKRQESIKDAIIGDVARTKIIDVIKENSVGDWYYIYDACVPSSIHANIGGKQALTMAKIWDPSKASTISKNELFESTHKNATLVSEGTYSQLENGQRASYTIFDWKRKSDPRESLYDKIYSDLLHLETISKKSLIKLRLAVSDENKCSVCIKIADKHFIIDSGFSVNELSAGLYYAEMSPNDYRQDIQQKTDKIRRDYLPPDITNPSSRIKKLVEIIDELKNHMDKKQIISTLLRFKSSGDHGQSKMCQIINNVLKEFCMFVSGDNLACVEAISLLDIPVLMRYYSPSSSSKDDEDEDEDEEDGSSGTCRINGTFFVCLYLPTGNNPDKLKAKLEEQVYRIQELLFYWAEGETREPVEVAIDTLNAKIEKFFENPFDANVETQRDDLLREVRKITIIQIDDLKKVPENIEEGKKRLQLLKSFADNVYLLYYWQTDGFKNIYNASVDKTILESFDTKLDRVKANLKRKRIEYPIIISNIIEQFEGRTTINVNDLYSVDKLSQIREQLKASFIHDVSRLKSEFSLDDGNTRKVETIVRNIKNEANKHLLNEIGNIKVVGIGMPLKTIIAKSLLQDGHEMSFSVTVPVKKKITFSRKIAKISKIAKIAKISKIRPTTNVTRGRQSTSKTRKSSSKVKSRKIQSLPNVLAKKRRGSPSPGSRSDSYQPAKKLRRTQRAK